MKQRRKQVAWAAISVGVVVCFIFAFVNRRGLVAGHSAQSESTSKRTAVDRETAVAVDTTQGDVDSEAGLPREVGQIEVDRIVSLPAVAKDAVPSQLRESSEVVGQARERSAAQRKPGVDSARSLPVGSAFHEDQPDTEEAVADTPTAPTPAEVLFAAEREEVERELEGAEGYDRDDLLVMFGKSASASGRFARAAAAYELFLEEFGLDHEYSPAIALKLGDCLAPLNLRNTGIEHTPSGPKFQGQWRMRYTPNEDMTRRAVGAYEQAASIAMDDRAAAQALLKLGWVYRVLDDWDASTDAWKRCASLAVGTKAADDAILFAAENLELIGRSSEAADLLRNLSDDNENSHRAQLAAAKASDLEYLAIRETDIESTDVVSMLEYEIQEREDVAPHAVYRSYGRWLARRGDRASLLAIQRWAVGQVDWQVKRKVICRLELVGTLLERDGVTTKDRVANKDKLEAVSVLREVVKLSSKLSWIVPAAIQRSRLLRELGEFAAADHAFDSLSEDTLTSSSWEPPILAERIRTKLDQGKSAEADRLLQDLAERYPDYWELKDFLPDQPTNEDQPTTKLDPEID